MKPLLSVNDLAARVGMRPHDLRELADSAASHYHHDAVKIGAVFRQLHIPDDTLMEVQRRLNRNVFGQIAPSTSAHGGVKSRSPRTNAGLHTGKHCVLAADVRKFFPHVRHGVVHAMLMHELGLGRDVAAIITKLVTYDGSLPQGAPTSTTVANLLLKFPLDDAVRPIAESTGLTYSRFVDDITISGADPRSLIQHVTTILGSRRLPIHRQTNKPDSKFRIMPSRSRQEVTGLVVNQEGRLTVPRIVRDKIRAAIFNLSRIEIVAEIHKAARSIRGRIHYIATYHPEQAERLMKMLDQTLETTGCPPELKPKPRTRKRKTPINLRAAPAARLN